MLRSFFKSLWRGLKPNSTKRTRRTILAVETLEDRTVPSGLVTSWQSHGVGGGGAFFGPSVSPFNTADLYVASDMTGLYHSTTGGASWSAVDFRSIQGSNVGDKVQFTSDANVLFAINHGSAQGSKPSRSLDGGATWQLLAVDPTLGGAFNLFADPENTTSLAVSDYSHLYFSRDGGAHWKTIATAPIGGTLQFAGAFFDGANVYLGTSQGFLTSSDGGATFSQGTLAGIGPKERMISFAGAKQNGVTRFVCTTGSQVYAGMPGTDYPTFKGLYTLDLGQSAWTSAMTGIGPGDKPFFVGLAANDISDLYFAGGNSSTGPIVYKSANGGASWQKALDTGTTQNVATGWAGNGGDTDWTFGGNAMGFAVAPNDPNTLVLTDMGFVHTSSDGGKSWHQVYDDVNDQNPAGKPTPTSQDYHGVGLEDTSAWWLTWSDPNTVFASFSDIRGVRSTDATNSWDFKYKGNPLNTTYQTLNQGGVLYAGISSAHDIYQPMGLGDGPLDHATGQVTFSTDQGATWKTLFAANHPVISLAVDPNNVNRLYASVIHSTQGGIYVTNDLQDGSASVWTRLASPTRTQGHPFNIQVLKDGTLVCTFSGRIDSLGNYTDSSGVFVSSDGGQSWFDRSAAAMHYFTKDILIDPNDATQSTWYAAVQRGTGASAKLGGLFRTTDRGLTWTQISKLNAESMTIDPNDPAAMYVTTDTAGLWRTTNLQAAQPTFSADAAYPFRHPERVFFNPFKPSEIWVTSFGYGLSVGEMTPAAGTVQFGSATFAVAENAGTATITVTRSGGTTGAVSVDYVVQGITATAGADFSAAAGTLSWADGDSAAKTFTVTILDDTKVEGNEKVRLLLGNCTGGALLGAASQASLTIQDDEVTHPGQFQFHASAYSVMENATVVTITVDRVGGSDGVASVYYSTSPGTATAGLDYAGIVGALVFQDGQTSRSFIVMILNDNLVEGDETFQVNLSQPTGGATLLGATTTTVTIIDDDLLGGALPQSGKLSSPLVTLR